MLETEIKALREEVALLREALATFGENLQQVAKAPAPKKEKPTPVIEVQTPVVVPEVVKELVVETPKVEAVKTKEAEQPKVSRDDLQSLCMTIVRADRTKRESIQAAISKFGATNLVGVKDEDLNTLHAELEALK